MTLTSREQGLFENVRDELQMIAHTESSELIKKFVKLDGLIKCLHKGAVEDPDLIGDLFDQLKPSLAKGRGEQEKRIAMKRALNLEAKEREKEQRQAAKKRKLIHDSISEASESADVPVDDAQEGSNLEFTASPATGVASGVKRNRNMGYNEPKADATTTTQGLPVDPADLSEASNTDERLKHRLSPVGTRSGSPRTTSGKTDSSALSPESALSIAELPAVSGISPMGGTITTAAELPAVKASRPLENMAPSGMEIAFNTVTQVAGETTSYDAERAEQTERPNGSSIEQTVLTVTPQLPTVDHSVTMTLPNNSDDSSMEEVVPASKKRNEAQEIMNQIDKKVWPKFSGRTKSDNKRDHDMDEIMSMIERLNFWVIQYRIIIFAEKRLRSPGIMAKVAELTDESDPVAVFHAIEASSAKENDAKLHRIFGQVRLVKTVQEKVDRGYVPKQAKLLPGTLPIEYTKLFLQDMAKEMTNGEPKNVQIRTWEKLRREHQAGKKWMKIMESFGGEGIVFILLFANVSSHAFSRTYTDFQRACVKFIFFKVPSLTRLVGCFGEDALDRFCRSGRIDDVTMDKIRDCEGPTASSGANEDDDEVE
ncbi:MAG: hypothetical protein Q9188_006416 [Gyalolechia gomerana]